MGTIVLLLLDPQRFTHSLVFLFCWVTSLIIWLPELWGSRYSMSWRFVCVLSLHLVAIGCVCLYLRDSYEHQKRFNDAVKAREDQQRITDHPEPHDAK